MKNNSIGTILIALFSVCFVFFIKQLNAEVWNRTNNPFYQSSYEEVITPAEEGNRYAQKRLADILKEGIGVKQDMTKAAKWYARSAQQMFAPAQNNLATMYCSGHGVPINKVEAARWFRRAADQDIAQSQFNLAELYRDGTGVLRSLDSAIFYMEKAARQGYAPAQYELGRMYQFAIPPNHALSLSWFRKAVDQEHVDALYRLAVCYHNGWGTKRSMAYALKLYQQAADKGSYWAHKQAGTIYYDPGDGLQPDYRWAEYHLLSAAKHLPDDTDILFALGRIYYNGGYGKQKDFSKALQWYKAAAVRGYSYAQHNLAMMYVLGHGTQPDLETGYAWYLMAAGKGLKASLLEVGYLQSRLKPGQIRSAEQRAARFKPAFSTPPQPQLEIQTLRLEPLQIAAGSRYDFHFDFLAVSPGVQTISADVLFRILRGSEILYESKPFTVSAQSGAVVSISKRGLPCHAPAGQYEFQVQTRNANMQATKTIEFVVR